jgi:hypothetical protein
MAEPTLTATRGARDKGDWSAEPEPGSGAHTLVAVKADTGVVGVIFTGYLFSCGGSVT